MKLAWGKLRLASSRWVRQVATAWSAFWLMCAAAAKLGDTDAMAEHLRRLAGVESILDSRALVAVAAAWQGVAGFAILGEWSNRFMRWICAPLLITLLVVELIIWSRGAVCGCFGRAEVPAWISWATLGAGAYVIVRGKGPSTDFVRGMWVKSALMIGACGFAIWSTQYASSEEGHAWGVASIVPDDARRVLIMTPECPECCRVLSRVSEKDGGLVVLVRAGEEGDRRLRATASFRQLRVIGVNERVWWSLLRSAPPRLVEREGAVWREGVLETLEEDAVMRTGR